jgi:hypothetical protein
MKALLVLLLVILGVAGYLLFGPSSSTPPKSAEQPSVDMPAGSPTGAAVAPSATASTTAPQPDQTSAARPRKSMGESIADNVTAVGGYAMGYNQFKVKQHANKKIDEVNKKHNDQLNELLGK